MNPNRETHPRPPDNNDPAAESRHDQMTHEREGSSHVMAEDAHPMMGGMVMSRDHERAMWEQGLWAHFVNFLLGVWLVTSPSALGYGSAALTRSDIASGGLVIVFSSASYSRRRGAWAQWANCFVGIWLLFAPLVFWTPDAAAYANNTLLGALVIAFAVLVPGMPGMDMSVMATGPDIPPGWSYNPSTWLQRAPIILLAAVGFFASRYMAAFQLGHISDVWDPAFGTGTRRVLQSDVSKMFPISDAGLGAVSYMFEILMGFMGDRARWRTMPWMVMFFGIVVVPLGVTSIVLVILQPVAVGAWCFLCLFAALAMLAMVPATLDEIVAMIQFLVQSRREGKSLWRTFWLGGVIEGGHSDQQLSPFDWSRPQDLLRGWLRSSWHLLVAAGIGGWLMFAPEVLGTVGKASTSDRLVGALVLTFALIATAEVARSIRFLNVVFAVWPLIAPWLVDGFVKGAQWSDVVAGIALFVLSLRRGPIRGRYGSWQQYIV
ncbi:MAG TPA: vitamin K epoxide reductase family protein [Terriglobales bacterium]|nr:vitamin K epoxide reductase family protein [Terriglobales bacterium]